MSQRSRAAELRPRTPEQLEVGVELLVSGFTSPVALEEPGDGSGRLFVADQTGLVKSIGPGGASERPFLDLRRKVVSLNREYDERGLLGLAFHPGFRDNGRFYVYYSAPLRAGGPLGFDHTNRLSEFRASGDVADPSSERVVLEMDHPYMNHNGGDITFGPDGYLYMPVGDGGNAADRGRGHTPATGNAQDLGSLLGKILRIDVDGGKPYAIPPDNPFARTSYRQEIYAYGLRNPWRISFDRDGDGELFAGDVGQYRWEEVDLIVKGGNYGWNIKEGSHCFNADDPMEPRRACLNEGYRGEELIDPIVEYTNAEMEGGIGRAVIGGHVYRGKEIPELQGRYVFGDWSTTWEQADGTVFAASRQDRHWSMDEVRIAGRRGGRLKEFVTSFGEDREGELYLLTSERGGPTGRTGKVYRLVP